MVQAKQTKNQSLNKVKIKTLKASVIRQCFGIDIGKKEFYVCYRHLHSDGRQPIKGSKKFANSIKGVLSFYQWSIKKMRGNEQPCSYLMEATGVYYEELAYFLEDEGCKVQVVLPNQSKAYSRSLNQKTKTDKVDAQMLALFGLERPNLRIWKPGSYLMRQVKKLSRLRTRLVKEKTRNSNQLHAEKYSFEPEPMVLSMLEQSIKEKKNKIKEIEVTLEKLVKEKDENLSRKIEKICRLKGLGFITVLTVIAETNGFQLFKNIKQLISYAGYDVVQNESGDRARKTRISKKGNRYIRAALHMPSLSVVRYNPDSPFEHLYQRVFERTKIKLKGYIAVQRKMLTIIYILYKEDQAYNADYHKKACQKDLQKK